MAKSVFGNFYKTTLTQIRYYPRWSHRKPRKIYTPEEYEQMEKKTEAPATQQEPSDNLFEDFGDLKTNFKLHPKETVYKIKNAPKVLTTRSQKKKGTSTDMLQTIIDQEGNFIYTKMAGNDQRVGVVLREVKSKKDRDKNDLVLLEGKKLIKDALEAKCHLKYLLFSRKDDVEDIKQALPKIGANLFKMPYKEMQMWSDLTTTPGIMGIFKTPDVKSYESPESLPFTVICDNIREPGNLGVILRICAGVGCAKVILTKGCVNLWDTKVLRSGCGAHFRLQIHKDADWRDIHKGIGSNCNVYVADNRVISNVDGKEKAEEILRKLPLLPYYGIDFKAKHVVVIVGGETLGISTSSYELALERNGGRLNIPLNNNIESLNVGTALGIIAFEVKKQLITAK